MRALFARAEDEPWKVIADPAAGVEGLVGCAGGPVAWDELQLATHGTRHPITEAGMAFAPLAHTG